MPMTDSSPKPKNPSRCARVRHRHAPGLPEMHLELLECCLRQHFRQRRKRLLAIIEKYPPAITEKYPPPERVG